MLLKQTKFFILFYFIVEKSAGSVYSGLAVLQYDWMASQGHS